MNVHWRAYDLPCIILLYESHLVMVTNIDRRIERDIERFIPSCLRIEPTAAVVNQQL